MENKINIWMNVNVNYVGHLFVAINSIKHNNNHKIEFFIGVPDQSSIKIIQKKINVLVSPYISINYIVVSNKKLRNIISGKYQKIGPAFFRIIAGSLLPKSIKKILYLDADVIVNSDLSELYNLDLRGTILGVSDECIGKYGCLFTDIGFLKEIKITKYINTGVLLINLEKWRVLNKENDMLRFLKKYIQNLDFYEQSILNIFFQNEIVYLDNKWNAFLGTEKKINIFHSVIGWKGNSCFCGYYKIKKMYKFYSKARISIAQDTLDIFFFIFLGYPLKLILELKRKIKYRVIPLNFYDFLRFFLIFYPPIFLYLIVNLIDIYKKKGFRRIFFVIKHILK